MRDSVACGTSNFLKKHGRKILVVATNNTKVRTTMKTCRQLTLIFLFFNSDLMKATTIARLSVA